MDACSMHIYPSCWWLGIKVSLFGGREKRRHEIVFQHPSLPQPRKYFRTESALHSRFFFLCTSWTLTQGLSTMPKPIPIPILIPIPMKIPSTSGVGTFFCLGSPTEATLSAVSPSSRFRFPPLTRIERISLLVSIFVGEMDVCVVQYIPVDGYAGWELR